MIWESRNIQVSFDTEWNAILPYCNWNFLSNCHIIILLEIANSQENANSNCTNSPCLYLIGPIITGIWGAGDQKILAVALFEGDLPIQSANVSSIFHMTDENYFAGEGIMCRFLVILCHFGFDVWLHFSAVDLYLSLNMILLYHLVRRQMIARALVAL